LLSNSILEIFRLCTQRREGRKENQNFVFLASLRTKKIRNQPSSVMLSAKPLTFRLLREIFPFYTVIYCHPWQYMTVYDSLISYQTTVSQRIISKIWQMTVRNENNYLRSLEILARSLHFFMRGWEIFMRGWEIPARGWDFLVSRRKTAICRFIFVTIDKELQHIPHFNIQNLVTSKKNRTFAPKYACA